MTVADKNLPLADATVASLINPAAVMTPPALSHNTPAVPYRTAPSKVFADRGEARVSCGHVPMNGLDASVGSRLSSGSEDGSVKEPIVEKREAKDFIFGKLIGEGSFSMVYLAKDIHTNKEYASEYFNYICRRHTSLNVTSLVNVRFYFYSQSLRQKSHHSREESGAHQKGEGNLVAFEQQV